MVSKCHDTTHRKFKDITREWLELINELGKVAGYKINKQKSVAFHALTMKYQREKLRGKKSHLPSCLK